MPQLTFPKTPFPYDTRNDRGTIPDGVAGTGTVTTVAGSTSVAGVGTLFTSELGFQGSTGSNLYIYINAAPYELREIVGVGSDTTIRVKTAFSNSTAAAAYFIVQRCFREVHVQNTAGAVTVNGQAITSTQDNLKFGVDGPLAPVIKYDATGGGTIAIQTEL